MAATGFSRNVPINQDLGPLPLLDPSGPLNSFLSELLRLISTLSISILPSNGHPSSSHTQSPVLSNLPAPLTILPFAQAPIPSLNPLPPLPRSSVASSNVPPPSFTDIVRSSILSQPAIKKPPFRQPTRSGPPPSTSAQAGLDSRPPVNPLFQRLAKMRDLTKKGVLVCYKCGDQGHSTSSCRNALICFRCNKAGHKSPNCPSSKPPISTSLPPPPTSPPPISNPLPMLPSLPQEAHLLPVIRYFETPATAQFRHSLSQGLVLTDIRRKGATYIQDLLTYLFPVPKWTWIARELGDDQFLVAPPDLEWRDQVLAAKSLNLGGIPFPMKPYDFHHFNGGRRLQEFWIQVYNFPHDLWRDIELRQLARELGGVLLDSDPRSFTHHTMRVLRLKIGVPDKEVIPSCRHLLFTYTNGKHDNYFLQILVEDPIPSTPWGHLRGQIFQTRKRARSSSPPQHRSDIVGPSQPPFPNLPIHTLPVMIPPYTSFIPPLAPLPPLPAPTSSIAQVLPPVPRPISTFPTPIASSPTSSPTNFSQPISQGSQPSTVTPIVSEIPIITSLPLPIPDQSAPFLPTLSPPPASIPPSLSPPPVEPTASVPVSAVPAPTVSVPAVSVPVSTMPVPVSAVPAPIISVPTMSVPAAVPLPAMSVPAVSITPVPVSAEPIHAIPVSTAPASSIPISDVPASAVLVPAPAPAVSGQDSALANVSRPPATKGKGKSKVLPTTSDEARYSLRLKMKEGTSKNHDGKGANSGLMIISSDSSIQNSPLNSENTDPGRGLEGSDLSDYLRTRAEMDDIDTAFESIGNQGVLVQLSSTSESAATTSSSSSIDSSLDLA
ncbi:uncharacterized protein LOC144573724 [Carex rostrata]